MGINGKGHIVAKADVINRSSQQIFLILLGKINLYTFSFPIFKNMFRIETENMDICKIITLLHGFHSHEDILRIASSWINRTHGNHTANLEVGIDFMTDFNCSCRSHQFVVSCLIHDGLPVISFFVENPGIGERSKIFLVVGLIVDFIEGHPVFDLVLIALEDDFCKADEEINNLAVLPTTILGYQMIRHFKVR